MNFISDDKPLMFRIGQIQQLARSKTAKNSAILFAGNVFNSFLSLFVVIFVSRALGPQNFGVLATFNAIVLTLVGITDFGLGTTAIRLITEKIKLDRRNAAIAMKVIVKLEVFSALLIAIFGLLFSTQIANLLGGQHLLLAVRLAFFAGFIASASAFIGPFFVAYERFLTNALVNVVGAVFRTIAVFILVAAAALKLNNVLVVYALVPLVSLLAGLYFAPRDYLTSSTREQELAEFKEIFHFSKWLLLSYIATAFLQRLDVFLLSHYKGSAAVGIYAAALQLASLLPLLISAIATVLLTNVSTLKRRTELTSYLKKTMLGSLVLVALLVPALVFGDFLIKLVFGLRFVNSLTPFKLIFSGYLIALFVTPVSLVFFALKKPKMLTFFSYTQLAVSVVLNIVLIPRIGANGAAATFLMINVLGGVMTIFFATRLVMSLSD